MSGLRRSVSKVAQQEPNDIAAAVIDTRSHGTPGRRMPIAPLLLVAIIGGIYFWIRHYPPGSAIANASAGYTTPVSAYKEIELSSEEVAFMLKDSGFAGTMPVSGANPALELHYFKTERSDGGFDLNVR